jgi:hypothetical protein
MTATGAPRRSWYASLHTQLAIQWPADSASSLMQKAAEAAIHGKELPGCTFNKSNRSLAIGTQHGHENRKEDQGLPGGQAG